MADDIASLGIAVDTSGLQAGTTALRTFGAQAQQTSTTVQQASAATTQGTQAATAAVQRMVATAANANQATAALTAGQRANAAASNQMIAGMTAATNATLLMTQGMTAAGQAAAAASRAANTNSVAHQNLANTGKLARYELINLSRQIQDVGVSLASGQALMTVAIQQGSQIGDVFASSNASLAGFGRQVLGMITPLRLLAGGIAAVVIGGAALALSWKNAELQFLALSERLGVPIAKLHELAQVAASKGIDLGDFVKGMEGFSEQVNQAKKGLGDLGVLLRTNGATTKGAVADYFKIADLVKNAASYEDKRTVLQKAGLPSTTEFVRLMEQGSASLRQQAADTVKWSDANKVLVERAREFDESWSRAWSSFSNNAKSAISDALTFLSKLSDSASGFLQRGIEGVKNFFRSSSNQATEGQQNTSIGQRLLSGGVGTTLDSKGASEFYNKIASAAGEASKSTTKLAGDTKALNDLFAQRVSLLGDLASVSDKVQVKQNAVDDARANGVNLSKTEAAAIVNLARAQEEFSKQSRTVSALGDAATTMEKYSAEVARLRAELAATNLTQAEFNRALLQINPVFKEVKNAVSDLGSALAQAFVNGADGADALNKALKSVSATATSSAINKLLSGDLTGAAISGAVAAVSFVGSKLFGSGNKEEDAKKQAEQDAAIAKAQQADAERIQKALEDQRQRAERLNRDVEVLRTQSISATQQKLVDINAAAADYVAALNEIGASTETVSVQLAEAITNLQQTFTDDLLHQLNDARGRSFVNDITDLLKAVAQNRQDAASIGLGTSLVEEVFQAKAQDIVDGAGLIGGAFDALIAQFPELSGVVHEASGNLQEIVDQLNRAGRTIVDYVNSLLVGPSSTLSPQAKFTQAQATYNATLALAQANNVDAIDRLTTDAENFRLAAQGLFGSSSGFQAVFDQIKSQLLGLGVVQDTTDPTTRAVRDAILAIQGTTTAVGGTTQAVAVGNNILTSANNLAASANLLQTSTNVLLDSIEFLTSTSVSTLAAIQILNTTSDSSLSQIQSAAINLGTHTGQLQQIVNNTAAIASNTGAEGGWVTGGVAGKDSVPYMLMPGEFIVKAQAAQSISSQYGRDVFSEFINKGDLPSVPVLTPISGGGSKNNVDMGAVVSMLGAIVREVAHNSAVTVASAEHIIEPLNDMRVSQREAVRETKRQAA